MSEPTVHKCIIAIPESGEGILVSSEPSLMEREQFDGTFLPDNITQKDTMPTEVGIYSCVIKCAYSKEYDHWSGGYEYDADLWIEDAVKIDLTPFTK